MRVVAALSAAAFLLSSTLNFGLKIPIGFTVLSFAVHIQTIAEFEILIGAFLVVAAIIPRLYVYGAAYLLAAVGIAEGLLSLEVQGLARDLHVIMVPLAVAGISMLVIETLRAYNQRAVRSKEMSREVIVALQFFVGGLVTLGGAEYARNGTYPIGTLIGVFHLSVGLTGLFAGYAFVKKKAWAQNLVLATNSITIAYSAFSETAAQVYSFLPPGINDSLIGTIIAIMVSAGIIAVIQSGNHSNSAPEKTRKEERQSNVSSDAQ
jgi:hypothetical protein